MAAQGEVAFELMVPQAAAAQAVRACGLHGVRAAAVTCVWHDTAERELAGRGLALGEWRGAAPRWRLERLWPEPGEVAPVGTPAARISEAATRAGLEGVPDGVLLPVGGFSGRMRSGQIGLVRAVVLSGAVRAEHGAGGALTAPCCRVVLVGPGEAVAALAMELAGVAGAAAAGSMAALALGGQAPIRTGAPVLPDGLSASAALAFVFGHLSDAIGAQARPAASGLASEPVHQMRVAVRRLRSAIKLFNGAVGGPELAGLGDGLRALGKVLGPARDWDVFLMDAGRDVGKAFAGDAGVTRLLAAARRRREAAYAALRVELGGVAFRQLGIRLALAALTRPWEDAAAEETGLRAFAARALGRRWRRMLAPGRHIAGLEPERLHAVRLDAKRLRYAAELFAPLWGHQEAHRFIRRLSAMQDRLGHLNDARVAAGLMAELGTAGRGRAGGIVEGFVTARAAGTREKIESGWRKLRKAVPFWN